MPTGEQQQQHQKRTKASMHLCACSILQKFKSCAGAAPRPPTSRHRTAKHVPFWMRAPCAVADAPPSLAASIAGCLTHASDCISRGLVPLSSWGAATALPPILKCFTSRQQSMAARWRRICDGRAARTVSSSRQWTADGCRFTPYRFLISKGSLPPVVVFLFESPRPGPFVRFALQVRSLWMQVAPVLPSLCWGCLCAIDAARRSNWLHLLASALLGWCWTVAFYFHHLPPLRLLLPSMGSRAECCCLLAMACGLALLLIPLSRCLVHAAERHLRAALPPWHRLLLALSCIMLLVCSIANRAPAVLHRQAAIRGLRSRCCLLVVLLLLAQPSLATRSTRARVDAASDMRRSTRLRNQPTVRHRPGAGPDEQWIDRQQAEATAAADPASRPAVAESPHPPPLSDGDDQPQEGQSNRSEHCREGDCSSSEEEDDPLPRPRARGRLPRRGSAALPSASGEFEALDLRTWLHTWVPAGSSRYP